jgi:hypothetical protein
MLRAEKHRQRNRRNHERNTVPDCGEVGECCAAGERQLWTVERGLPTPQSPIPPNSHVSKPGMSPAAAILVTRAPLVNTGPEALASLIPRYTKRAHTNTHILVHTMPDVMDFWREQPLFSRDRGCSPALRRTQQKKVGRHPGDAPCVADRQALDEQTPSQCRSVLTNICSAKPGCASRRIAVGVACLYSLCVPAWERCDPQIAYHVVPVIWDCCY